MKVENETSTSTSSASESQTKAASTTVTQTNTDEQLDRILGIIYGNALGDAVGLATEFLDKKQSFELHGDLSKKIIDFPKYKKTFHSIRWKAGDWTDDTDQLILIMQSLIQHKLQVNVVDFAKRLYNWMRQGFPELGDQGGMGIGATVFAVLRHHDFLDDPHSAAEEVWKQGNENLAANGAVMRTAITGIPFFNDLSKVVQNTLEYCKVTHADTRCKASCVAVTTAIALTLQGKHKDQNGDPDVPKIMSEAYSEALKHLNPKYTQEFKQHYEATTVDTLKLDESHAIGYTFKCMGSAFYCFQATNKDFKWLINDVIKEGGDADTNGAVCGALLGARLGYSKLPKDWLASFPQPNRKWLDDQVVKFCVLLGFDEQKVKTALGN